MLISLADFVLYALIACGKNEIRVVMSAIIPADSLIHSIIRNSVSYVIKFTDLIVHLFGICYIFCNVIDAYITIIIHSYLLNNASSLAVRDCLYA